MKATYYIYIQALLYFDLVLEQYWFWSVLVVSCSWSCRAQAGALVRSVNRFLQCDLIQYYWISIGSDRYWTSWCPAVQLELQGTGWSWWEHFEEKSGRVHNFPWTLSHLEGNLLEISQTSTICYMLDFLTRFLLAWILTSYWLLASWFHLIWLCIGELTRRIQA